MGLELNVLWTVYMIYTGGLLVFSLKIIYTGEGFNGVKSYGRYSIAKTDGASREWWLKPVPAKLSWFLFEVPNLVLGVVTLVYATKPFTLGDPRLLVVSCFMAHYFIRTILYSLLLRGGKPNPVVFVIQSAVFTSINGYAQMRYHSEFWNLPPDAAWFTSPRMLLGFALWIAGLVINQHSDHILRNLRRPGDIDKGKYFVPHGGLFKWVSGANFTGECIEWLGYAVMTMTEFGWGFALTSIIVIGYRAIAHHEYYLEKMDGYASLNRKAFIPYVL